MLFFCVATQCGRLTPVDVVLRGCDSMWKADSFQCCSSGLRRCMEGWLLSMLFFCVATQCGRLTPVDVVLLGCYLVWKADSYRCCSSVLRRCVEGWLLSTLFFCYATLSGILNHVDVLLRCDTVWKCIVPGLIEHLQLADTMFLCLSLEWYFSGLLPPDKSMSQTHMCICAYVHLEHTSACTHTPLVWLILNTEQHKQRQPDLYS
jgi:hypothetical protein